MALHCDLVMPHTAAAPLPSGVASTAACNSPAPSGNGSSPAHISFAKVRSSRTKLRHLGRGASSYVASSESYRKDSNFWSVRCEAAGKSVVVVEQKNTEEVKDVFVWRPPFGGQVDLLTVAKEDGRSPEEVLYRSWIASGFGNAAVKSSPPPRHKKEGSHKDEFYLNAGYAIRTLREELPSMFYKDLTYDIYRDDILFRDPLNTFGGIQNYKLIFGALRFHGKIFFKAIWVDIVRVWQPCENVITVRWTVRGVPRVPWEAQGRFDGTSEYKLDKEGKIYEHKVDNVLLNSPPKFHAQTVLDLVRVAHTNPTPTFYSKFGGFMVRLSPYMQRFTWVRYYWALICTIALIDKRDLCNDTAVDAS